MNTSSSSSNLSSDLMNLSGNDDANRTVVTVQKRVQTIAKEVAANRQAKGFIERAA